MFAVLRTTTLKYLSSFQVFGLPTSSGRRAFGPGWWKMQRCKGRQRAICLQQHKQLSFACKWDDGTPSKHYGESICRVPNRLLLISFVMIFNWANLDLWLVRAILGQDLLTWVWILLRICWFITHDEHCWSLDIPSRICPVLDSTSRCKESLWSLHCEVSILDEDFFRDSQMTREALNDFAAQHLEEVLADFMGGQNGATNGSTVWMLEKKEIGKWRGRGCGRICVSRA